MRREESTRNEWYKGDKIQRVDVQLWWSVKYERMRGWENNSLDFVGEFLVAVVRSKATKML